MYLNFLNFSGNKVSFNFSIFPETTDSRFNVLTNIPVYSTDFSPSYSYCMILITFIHKHKNVKAPSQLVLPVHQSQK